MPNTYVEFGWEILLAFRMFFVTLMLIYVMFRCCCLCVPKSMTQAQVAEATMFLTPADRPNAYI